MPKFRKKPVEIEAIQFIIDQQYATFRKIVEFMGEAGKGCILIDDPEEGGYHFFIPTLEGEMRCNLNDWVIKGINGEFYPCKPDIFVKTYEMVI